MSTDLTFYTNPMSRGRIVRWMLEEVGVPYGTEVLQYGTTMKAPAYLAINPMGKVPAIKHGDLVVTEAAAICAYLADAFPQANLAPAADSKARGAYYRWLFFGAGCIEPAVTSKALGFVAPADKKGMVGFGSMEEVVSALDAALTSQDYLAGDAFSAADLYICSQLAFGMNFDTIEKRPSFERYVGRLYARPAAIRANQIDDALIAEQQAG